MERRLFIKKVMGWCGALLALVFGYKAHINGRHQLTYRKAFKPVNPDIGVAVKLVPSDYVGRGTYKWSKYENRGTVTWVDHKEPKQFGTFCEPDAGWDSVPEDFAKILDEDLFKLL